MEPCSILASLVSDSLFCPNLADHAGCAIERIYVHSSKFDEFVKVYAELAKEYKLGDPRKAETTLGPVVSVASAARIRKQVKDAGKLISYETSSSLQSPLAPSLSSTSLIFPKPKRVPPWLDPKSSSTSITVSPDPLAHVSFISHGDHDGRDIRPRRRYHEGRRRR